MKKILVNSMVTLKQLQKAGHITLHEQTGKTVYSPFGKVRAWYIEDSRSHSFKHEEKEYRVEYRSGCFNPFVFEIVNP